jgi:hypothetical protein
MPEKMQWWLAELKKERIEGQLYIPTMVPLKASSKEEAKAIARQEGCLDYGIVGPFATRQQLCEWFF